MSESPMQSSEERMEMYKKLAEEGVKKTQATKEKKPLAKSKKLAHVVRKKKTYPIYS